MSSSAPEDRFARAIVKLVKYFNLLDTNIGLCLSHLLSPNDPAAWYSKLASQTPQQRFDQLKALVAQGIGTPSPVAYDGFNDWWSQAEHARSIRNRYLHGNWEYIPQRKAPIGVSSPPWMRDRLGSDATQAMTINELEATAEHIAQVFRRFMEIRQRHNI